MKRDPGRLDGIDRQPAVLRLRSVSIGYGGPDVLSGVELALAPGSYHFLTGRSGAGKSSLLGLVYLALRPSTGRVELFGEDVSRLSRRALARLRRRVGVVFQDFRLLDHLSALDNVALPLRVAGERPGQALAHARELLEWVGLADRIDARPPTLSGGEKQRVAIARAVIGRPSLLVADEPTGSVDDEIAERLMRLFEELNRLGTTVLVATHNRSLVERFAHPEIRIESGRVRVAAGLAAA